MTSQSSTSDELNLRAGDWVEVRGASEILATLDDQASLDALPFMPEMLEFCGKTYRVYANAHKTCDTIQDWKTIRRMENAVHLEGLRCDGAAHGGCQAGCLIFWKEAWLKRTDAPDHATTLAGSSGATRPIAADGTARADLTVLTRATRRPSLVAEDTELRYICQATQHVEATTPMRWWDPRHYVRDLTSGNHSLGNWIRTLAIAGYNNVMRRIPGGRIYPYVRGQAPDKKTPTQILNIQEGELVRVRSKDEIMPTIDSQRKNRGMIFDEEMVPFCDNTYSVLRRVEHIIDERTGKMLHFGNPCLVLDGVACGGCLSRYRLFCPRSIYPYWREIWLERVDGDEQAALPEAAV